MKAIAIILAALLILSIAENSIARQDIICQEGCT